MRARTKTKNEASPQRRLPGITGRSEKPRGSETKVPPRSGSERAREEIYSVLADDMRISTVRMDKILAKHGVKRNAKELQRAYRLSVGQRMVAGVRNAKGQREILALRTENGTEYVVVEACSDPQALAKLQHRLRGCISTLENTSGKVQERQGALASIRKKLFRGRAS